MAKKNDYRQYLKQTLGGLIDRLDLSDLRKDFLKNRWLDQVMWLEGRATKERNRHYSLRMITIIGGVIVPALIGFEKGNNRWQIIGWSAFGLSQAVAVSAAIEEFFAHGENYRNYRNTAEGLKIEGWQFFQMAGPYRQFATHSDAYTIFAERVEQYIQQDVKGFIAQLAERQEESKKETKETAQQNTELALEKLNEQLQLQAQYEAQLQELEAEKQRVEAERQQWEQERSAQSQNNGEIPADKAAEVASEQLLDLSTIAIKNWHEDEADRDSTSVSADSVEYLSASEILARVKSNPIGTTSAAQAPSGAASTTTSTKVNEADPAKVCAVMGAVSAELKSYAEKSVPLILKECAECGVTDPGQIAYIFATAEHESHLGQWMIEFDNGNRYNGRKDLGNTQPGDGPRFKGRGFCQVTGRTNYKMWSEKLGIDLVSNPEKAADEVIAAKTMVRGMRDGSFTGKKLSHYISGSTRDFRNARRIINGTDRADHIAAIAQRYYNTLA
jgi:predicted chitinase